MLLAVSETERTECLDAGDEVKDKKAVVVWKMRWSWWCGSHSVE